MFRVDFQVFLFLFDAHSFGVFRVMEEIKTVALKSPFFYSVALISFLQEIAYHSVNFFHLFSKRISQIWE